MLANAFPTVAAILGEEMFGRLSDACFRNEPPRANHLLDYGDGLAGSSFNYGFGAHTDWEWIEAAAQMIGDVKLTTLLLPGIGTTHDLDEALKLADHLVILKDGHIVQQGEPQEILMHPNDPYITDFISDINRARVLRVRSVMAKTTEPPADSAGDISDRDNLESVIARSDGDTDLVYRVVKKGNQVGILEMKELVKALVPVDASEGDNRSRY